MRPRIVAAFLSRDQEFQTFQADDASAAAGRAGIDIEVLFGGDNAILQIQQLYPFIHAPARDRPTAIVIETVTGEGLERMACEATAAGIGWILINRRVRYIHSLRTKNRELPICCVSTDQQEAGRIQGRQLRALLPAGGQVLYIEGPPDTSVAQERLAGTRDAIRQSSISLHVYAGEWTETSGYRAAAGWLRPRLARSVRPGAVAAQNDLMAVGARRAFLELRPGWSDVPFLGCDGLPKSGKRLVDRGELAATVVTPSNAGPAVELVARWLQEGVLPGPELLLSASSHPDPEQLAPATARAPAAAFGR